MLRRLIAAASLLSASALLAQPLGLRDAATEALARNPQIAAASAGTGVARAQWNEARAAWLPVLDASATSSRGNNPVFVFGSLLEQGRFAPEHFDPLFLNAPPSMRNDRLNFTARFALFDQLRRYDAVKQAREGMTRAERLADETRQEVLAEVIRNYYGLAVAEQRRAVAADAVRAAESAAKATRDKAEQGLVVDADRLAAEVQLAQFRQQEIAAAGNIAIARAALAMTLHRPLVEQISVQPALPETPAPVIDLDAATAEALRARAALAAIESARVAAELQLRTARGALLPRVDAVASWGASGATFAHRNSDHTVSLVASLSVFDGANHARIAEARAHVEEARAMEAMTRDRIVMETIAAWNRLNTARQQLEVAALAVEQAQSASRIVQDRYENGLTTITEALRAQTALASARQALLDARYQAIAEHAELLRSTGGLRDIEPFL